MRTLCVVLALILSGCVSASGASHESPEPVASFAPVEAIALDQDRAGHNDGHRFDIVDDRLVHQPRETARPVVAVAVPRLVVVARSSGHRTIRGIASRMGSGFGSAYLALPEGPGHRVRICAKRCWTMTSTDAGPSLSMQRDGRVCDLNDDRWAYITGLPLSRGLGWVTVTYL